MEAGASISSPANVDNVGGRVILVGANVTNNGSISTPDGQTILAAGLQVGIAASSQPTLRGLDVFVGSISDTANPSAGLATNNGIIAVPRGDAYLVGGSIKQMAVIDSTTSVTLNGRIDLLADYNSFSATGISGAAAPFLPLSTGAVVLGDGSTTEVLPEWSSADTVTQSQFSLNSEIDLQGLAVHLAGDATVFAPGGTINVNAGTWHSFVNGTVPGTTFVHSTGQIYLDSGATIDAQGSWDVSAPVSQNIISVQLLGPELEELAASARWGIPRPDHLRGYSGHRRL